MAYSDFFSATGDCRSLSVGTVSLLPAQHENRQILSVYFFFLYVFVYEPHSRSLFINYLNEISINKVKVHSQSIGVRADMHIELQSTLVISNSKGLSEILRDIRSSTYLVCRIEEKII